MTMIDDKQEIIESIRKIESETMVKLVLHIVRSILRKEAGG